MVTDLEGCELLASLIWDVSMWMHFLYHNAKTRQMSWKIFRKLEVNASFKLKCWFTIWMLCLVCPVLLKSNKRKCLKMTPGLFLPASGTHGLGHQGCKLVMQDKGLESPKFKVRTQKLCWPASWAFRHRSSIRAWHLHTGNFLNFRSELSAVSLTHQSPQEQGTKEKTSRKLSSYSMPHIQPQIHAIKITGDIVTIL